MDLLTVSTTELCTLNFPVTFKTFHRVKFSLKKKKKTWRDVVYAGNECNRKSFVRHPVMLHCSGCSRARGKP